MNCVVYRFYHGEDFIVEKVVSLVKSFLFVVRTIICIKGFIIWGIEDFILG